MNHQEQVVTKDKLIFAASLLNFDVLTADNYFVVTNYHSGNTLLKAFPDNEEGYCEAIALMRTNNF